MEKNHGPFRLTGGTHGEDYPVGVSFTVKEIGQGIVIDDQGRRWVGSRGTYIMHQGKEHIVYVGERKLAPPELNVGDAVELALEREFDRNSEPFMSGQDLVERFNTPGSMKFERANDKVQADELASLRKERDELKQRVAQLGGQSQAANVGQVKNPLPPSKPEDDGLDKLNVKQLQDLAAEEEIELGRTNDRAGIVRIIRQARSQLVTA